MATGLALAPQSTTRPLEDPLAHLPCSRIVEYQKAEIIYGEGQAPTGLYLVIEGKVKICRSTSDGHQVVMDIYQCEEFFGESAFVGDLKGGEVAVALEKTKAMIWTVDAIEELATRRPQLAMALIQLLVQRSVDFGSRIESLSLDTIVRRLAYALVRFSERLGQETEDGSVQMVPLTHEFLSQYVGTSREVITFYMLQFRRQGYLSYSRQGIQLHRDAMKDWLRHGAASS
ncbi:MAG TPA: Crp/Fnr family transcriptional regulator [Bryobacteraceae bacterium]|nr:Crp/Fnr family transcriptional regulator [Bryobacteraceae bacterium]